MKLYTIGHSNRTIEQFLSALAAYNITSIYDIRGGRAGSRAHPHFESNTLADTLSANGIQYQHVPELGGRRPKQRQIDPSINGAWRVQAFHNYADYAYASDDFDSGLKRLLAAPEQSAFMCSEVLPWKCHRSIVADYLILLDGIEVRHIIDETQVLEAKVHPFVVVKGNLKLSYPS